jgi:hexosaminidase
VRALAHAVGADGRPDVIHWPQDLLTDMTGGARGSGLFFDNMLHLGGDEVDTSCWSSTPAVAQWMQQNVSRRAAAQQREQGLTGSAQNLTPDETYMYFVKRAQVLWPAA